MKDTPAQPDIPLAPMLLEQRNRDLGNLLLTERAVIYVTILYAMLELRRNYELEPLHEDLYAATRKSQDEPDYAPESFNQDIAQLLRWNMISERVEKERLRGYKDTRRRKFRYRLHDETTAFLLWLEARRRDDLEPADADTRDLLGELIATLRESSRLINKTRADAVDYEIARSIFYRLGRMNSLTESVSQTLGELNIRLLGFATGRYDAPTARTILNELEYFLKNFLNRIHTLRQEITPEISRLLQPRYTTRWQACLERMEEERRATANLMRTRLSQPVAVLHSLGAFYAHEGNLEQLCARVNTAGLMVWRKLYTHLRELERRNHRLEDLRARITEIAALPPNAVPTSFISSMLATTRMVGNMHYWDDHTKSLPPQPRWERRRLRQDTTIWLEPKERSDGRPAKSLEDGRLRELEEWLLRCKLITPQDSDGHLSLGSYNEFEDFPRMIELSRSGLLGRGARLARLGLATTPATWPATVSVNNYSLSFNDLELHKLKPHNPESAKEDQG